MVWDGKKISVPHSELNDITMPRLDSIQVLYNDSKQLDSGPYRSIRIDFGETHNSVTFIFSAGRYRSKLVEKRTADGTVNIEESGPEDKK